LQNNSEKGIDQIEIVGVTTVLLNAGGQELAVVLSSMTYYLVNNPRCLEIAQAEALIQQSSTYMNAVINETIRLHPPAAGKYQRRTGQAGHMVDGYYIPPDVSLTVSFRGLRW
jgi:cytochrome P450